MALSFLLLCIACRSAKGFNLSLHTATTRRVAVANANNNYRHGRVSLILHTSLVEAEETEEAKGGKYLDGEQVG